jgi:hypothetical protein
LKTGQEYYSEGLASTDPSSGNATAEDLTSSRVVDMPIPKLWLGTGSELDPKIRPWDEPIIVESPTESWPFAVFS